jgi:2-dehydro-3-deoxyphosphogluconate aldolase / (4S)-4-hydroxy-2-oxoglutarate aldolase
MNKILEQIGLLGVIPVIVIENEDHAEPLAHALVESGLPCAEITFRTDAARNSIFRMNALYPSMMIGAGTVLKVDQVKIAVDAGAKYIVSPGVNRSVVEYCVKNNIPITPGVATPTEVEMALEFGLDVLKFFPAEANGGLNYLKAISAPYPKVKYIPTGGIDQTNLLSYLKFPKVLACGGSWMVKQELMANGAFNEIKRLTAQAMGQMLGFSLRHIGINTADKNTANQVANQLSNLFQFQLRDTEGSVFVGEQFEILKRIYLGKNGHIAITTNFIDRALNYFERNGIKILPETKNELNGKLQTVYLDIDIGGFAVHLVQI